MREGLEGRRDREGGGGYLKKGQRKGSVGEDWKGEKVGNDRIEGMEKEERVVREGK
jgi:hypothetical protein